MQYVRNLIESKPINSRVPDQSNITSSTGIDTGNSPNKIVATRDENNQWAFIYLTKGGSVTMDMTNIFSTEVDAQWYNPRDGTYSSIGRYPNTGTRQFTAPSSGEDNDWVLCLDAYESTPENAILGYWTMDTEDISAGKVIEQSGNNNDCVIH